MQKTLLLLSFLFSASFLAAQCDQLFISEYVEGYANNKALEIYNPTSSAINLSGYSLVRFSNGSTVAGDDKIIQLPDVMLAAKDVYVVVVDLTDMSLFDSQFDKPVWNGYNIIDTLFDSVTGEVILDSLGNVVFGPQYNDNGSALFGTDVYNEEYDLQGKADVFLCPDYDVNNVMYFNGNDAMALITGTTIIDASNLVDVIGVIGEDPEDFDEDAWVNEEGYWLTKDRSLVRKPEITTGRIAEGDVVAPNGTFIGTEWISYPKNSFQYLQAHTSACETTNTIEFNEIPFFMSPNPTKGEVLIEASENIKELNVYNLMGQAVHSQTFENANSQVNFDLSGFASGMYIVNITFDENKLSTQKLIVE